MDAKLRGATRHGQEFIANQMAANGILQFLKNAKVALANAEADIQDTRHTLPAAVWGLTG